MNRGASCRAASGVSLAEICAALFLIGAVGLICLPALGRQLDAMHLSSASSRLSLLFHQLRFRAVSRSACAGVVFIDDGPRGIVYLVVDDGNGNGIRRADVESGADPVTGGPYRLDALEGGVRFGIRQDEPVPVLPPGSGFIVDPSDPIRFGSADIASFTPRGTSTSGTVYIVSRRGRMRAVRLYGTTGRIQTWQYVSGRDGWVRR